jgi:lipoprotein-anchoring transpeptidase ErfK/SrfK
MAKLKFLPYRSLSELVAERFHTDQDYLRQLNAGQKIDDLRAGATIKVPAVEPFLIETIYPNPAQPEEGAKPSLKSAETPQTLIRIHRAEHILDVWEGEKMIASFPVSVGPPENETPSGNYTIKQSIPRPVFRYDKKMLKEGVRGEEAWVLPPGPNNPVGVIWNQTSQDGIGLHGTHDPDLIGRNISSGCVRLSNWDVVSLTHLLRPGTKLIIE